MKRNLYTVRWECGDEAQVPYSQLAVMPQTGKVGRDDAYILYGKCRDCTARGQARSAGYIIDYDTATGTDGTPVDGWYPSTGYQEIPAGSNLTVNGADGTPDWDATGKKILAKWLQLNGTRPGGRVRIRLWRSSSAVTGPADLEMTVPESR